jgi:predicted membrane chloride channel (bestrophin family)
MSFFEAEGISDKAQSLSLQVWSTFNFVLGFLVVFRTQKAYVRYWEGASRLEQAKAEWFNAVSSLIAFCSYKEDKKEEVEKFQHLLVRLISLLFCKALQQVADMDDENFEIIDCSGIDKQALQYMETKADKTEVILQWIQKLIVMNADRGVLSVPPPVLSRAYQELSRGIVALKGAQKIADILFPFPYVQMVTVMLLIHLLATPLLTSVSLENWWSAGLLTFVSTFSLWSINYIASEIENPFGDDPNDLPLREMQQDLNASLSTMIEKDVQMPPKFHYKPKIHAALYRRSNTIRVDMGHTNSLDGLSETSPCSSQKSSAWLRSESPEPPCDMDPISPKGSVSPALPAIHEAVPPCIPAGITPVKQVHVISGDTPLSLEQKLDRVDLEHAQNLIDQLRVGGNASVSNTEESNVLDASTIGVISDHHALPDQRWATSRSPDTPSRARSPDGTDDVDKIDGTSPDKGGILRLPQDQAGAGKGSPRPNDKGGRRVSFVESGPGESSGQGSSGEQHCKQAT